MWIRDQLPKSVPGLRAMLYGYESKLVQSDSFQSISDIARNLIWHLKAGGWNVSSSKPVVFLAHSLGGIVLKDAVVQMADRDKSVAGILDNIQGAIMFGVPSLGMHQSHLMAMVDGQPNEMLVQDLSRVDGNTYLRQLNTSFLGVSFVRTARVLWAYETEESPTVVKRGGTFARDGPKAVLVNPGSATCNYHRTDKALTIPINKNHSNLVKFSRGDPALDIVICAIIDLCSPGKWVGRYRQSSAKFDVVNEEHNGLGEQSGRTPFATTDSAVRKSERTLTEATKPPRTGEEDGLSGADLEILEEFETFLLSVQDIHSKLHFPELDYRMSQIEEPFQATFKWVFDLPIFSRWLQAGTGLFWINGKPGSGKSTLMKYIYNSQRTWELLHDWKNDSVEIKAGFFFHYRGTAMQKSFEGLLTSLIIQILSPHYNAVLKKYKPAWEEAKSFIRKYQNLRQSLANVKTELAKAIEELQEARQERIRQFGRVATAKLQLSDLCLQHEMEVMRESRVIEGNHQISAQQKHLQDQKVKIEQLQQQLVSLRQGDQITENRIEDLGGGKIPRLELESRSLRDTVDATLASIFPLLRVLPLYKKQPEAMLLDAIVEDFRNCDDEQVQRLERVFGKLLDQDIIQMDLVLFFDALDEFDGHLGMMTRFLKSLTTASSTSATRVKVCFSSRPWQPLMDDFAEYPSFSLQDYTKSDIEKYLAGVMIQEGYVNTSLVKVIPYIITRANGVFLWVKLALKELFRAITTSSEAMSPEQLIQSLRKLPSDLFDFYRLIVERISEANRRRTFALLELLARSHGPPPTASSIRNAVLTSDCTTLEDARAALQHTLDNFSQDHSNIEERDRQISYDISSWAGGLVEVKTQGSVNHLQLMHQTVLEFIMGMLFKETVMGEVSSLVSENGHSYHLKYWITWACFAMRSADHSTQFSEQKQLAAYHAEMSELTTGNSHLDFISSVPANDLRYLFGIGPWCESDDAVFLTVAVSCGLTLCIRDWIAHHPGELKRISNQAVRIPLLTPLVLKPASGVFHGRHLAAASLLLDNGYHVAQDIHFFPSVIDGLWNVQSKAGSDYEYGNTDFERTKQAATTSALRSAAVLALSHGQDPNLKMSLLSKHNLHQCAPLHTAPVYLADELIAYGADINVSDSKGRTPLDWVIQLPFELEHGESHRWSCAQRYTACCTLFSAGGRTTKWTSASLWDNALMEFESEGYDIDALPNNGTGTSNKANATSRLALGNSSSQSSIRGSSTPQKRRNPLRRIPAFLHLRSKTKKGSDQ